MEKYSEKLIITKWPGYFSATTMSKGIFVLVVVTLYFFMFPSNSTIARVIFYGVIVLYFIALFGIIVLGQPRKISIIDSAEGVWISFDNGRHRVNITSELFQLKNWNESSVALPLFGGKLFSIRFLVAGKRYTLSKLSGYLKDDAVTLKELKIFYDYLDKKCTRGDSF